MKLLVIGGTGFLGRHLCRTLSKSHEVTIISRRNFDSSSVLREITGIDYIQGDIASFEFINEACKDIDCLINLASTVVPSTSNRDPVYDINTNLIGALNTLQASINNNIARYIFLSSGGTVYGANHSGEPHRETDQTEPICSYGIVKLSIEKYIHMFNVLYGLPYSIIRLSNPYGPDYSVEKPQGAIHHFIAKAINNDEISIWGDGSIERDFIYIDDVISALCQSMQYSNSQCLFNIGSGTSTSINTILEIIKEVSGLTLKINYQEPRPYDVQKSVLNIDNAKLKLGWEPKINISDGIRMTYQSALRNI